MITAIVYPNTVGMGALRLITLLLEVSDKEKRIEQQGLNSSSVEILIFVGNSAGLKMSCFPGFKLEILFSFLAFALLGIRLVILPLSQVPTSFSP